jgi:ADP-ribose pyrophosphatase
LDRWRHLRVPFVIWDRGNGEAVAMETVLQSDELYRGRKIGLRVDRVRMADGRETTREVVFHPGAVAIVPLLPDGRVIMIRQYRHATGEVLLELPAGTRDQPGEAPADTAARELIEETGYRAGRVVHLADFYTAPGFCDELMSLYLATDLAPGDQNLMDDEAIGVEALTLDAAHALVADGTIRDAKTIVGLFLARERVGTECRVPGAEG